MSFGVVCGGVCCLTIFVLGTATVGVTVFASPDKKTVTREISTPKTKVIKQPVQQPSKPAANDAARTAIKPIAPQKPLSSQQSS